MQRNESIDAEETELRARWSVARAGYSATPIEASTVSGLLPEKERKPRGIYALPPRDAREERVAVPTREVVCYECGKRSRIPIAALSAHCVHCRAHLNTADFTLKPGSRRLMIRTLGDVTLPAHVELSHLSIMCRNLTVSGKGEGVFHCTGTLAMRGSARLVGQVQAGVLQVSPGARVEVDPGASADMVELEGRFAGRLTVRGELRIGKNGWLAGDCLTEQLQILPGGRHEGSWIRGMS